MKIQLTSSINKLEEERLEATKTLDIYKEKVLEMNKTNNCPKTETEDNVNNPTAKLEDLETIDLIEAAATFSNYKITKLEKYNKELGIKIKELKTRKQIKNNTIFLVTGAAALVFALLTYF